MTDVRRFILAYRWELWLIVGIPFASEVARVLLTPQIYALVWDVHSATHLTFLVATLAELLLYSVSYLFVRRLGRGFLTVLWGYTITVSLIAAMTQSVLLLMGELVLGVYESALINLGWMFLVHGLATPFYLIALLWFARRASVLSLTHALFLVAYSSFTVVGAVEVSSSADSPYLIGISLLAGCVITLTVMLVRVWLLGNFDLRGPEFRRNAVIGLVAVPILSGYAGVLVGELIGYAEGPYLTLLPLLGFVWGLAAFVATTAVQLITLVVLFVLVYLVRVRQPDTPPVSPSEQR